MALKNNWANGDTFTPAAANDMANAVNAATAVTVNGTALSNYELDPTSLTASDVRAYTRDEVDDAIEAAKNGPQLIIPAVVDSAGGNVCGFVAASGTSANYLRILNAASGSQPTLQMIGTDSDVGLTITTNGTGRLSIYSYGNAPAIGGSGPNANEDFDVQSKGTGVVKANGVQVADISSQQTLSSKTLSSPKIDSIKDSNGNSILSLSPMDSAANYLVVSNGVAGTSPFIAATGSDTNVSVLARPKGNGRLTCYVSTGQTPTIAGSGDDSNHDLNLVSKGSGTVRANGFNITTTSVVSVTGTSTLSAVPNRHYVILLGSGAVATLPTAVSNTSLYYLKNVHTASLTVAVTSSETIDGGTGSLTILPKQCYTLVSDGSNWVII